MDTQNNAKGGYGYGGDANNKARNRPLRLLWHSWQRSRAIGATPALLPSLSPEC